jgi:hypothetical protein
MKRREIASAIVATILLFTSGCVVADRPGRHMETYFYYPDSEVYYYPRVSSYYWRERDEWRLGPKPPSWFDLRDRDRVRIDMDHDPHTDHDRIKKSYPPGRRDRDDRRMSDGMIEMTDEMIKNNAAKEQGRGRARLFPLPENKMQWPSQLLKL